jgi:hypothetical protein
VRYFLRPTMAPTVRRILLVESGSRHLIEGVVPHLKNIFGAETQIDLVTCFPGTPRVIDGAAAVYRTADFQSRVARGTLYRQLRANNYQVCGIICSAEPIMTRWKWMLAMRVPAHLFLLNENGDFVWFDSEHLPVLAAYAQTRAGLEGAGAVRTIARIVLFPLTLLYLLLYASFVHGRRALRQITTS